MCVQKRFIGFLVYLLSRMGDAKDLKFLLRKTDPAEHQTVSLQRLDGIDPHTAHQLLDFMLPGFHQMNEAFAARIGIQPLHKLRALGRNTPVAFSALTGTAKMAAEGKQCRCSNIAGIRAKRDGLHDVRCAADAAADNNGNVSLQMLLSGQAGLKDMSGPVGIVQIMSDTAEASESALDAFMNMLYFGGFIAINLAVMNLLPIPALDGGRVVGLLLTTAAEKITGKKIDPKYEGYLHGAGMILLLALMAIIMFKDIFVLFKG